MRKSSASQLSTGSLRQHYTSGDGGPPAPIEHLPHVAQVQAPMSESSNNSMSTHESDDSTDESLSVLMLGENGERQEKMGKEEDIQVHEQEVLKEDENIPTSPKGKHRHKVHQHHNHTEKSNPPARAVPMDWQMGQSAWPSRDALSFTRSLIFYGEGSATREHVRAAKFIREARELRAKYFGEVGVEVKDASKLDGSVPLECKIGADGVMELFTSISENPNISEKKSLVQVPSIIEFVCDYTRLTEIASDGAMRSFCFQRLQLLSNAFKMHVTANGTVENEEQANLLGTDFYRTMKVDNHIHLAAAASAKQFVNFVRDKLDSEADTVVLETGQTLQEVFDSAGLDCQHLTIDAFNVLADYSVYQRFDNFNSKYSPFRKAEMRKLFLKVDNHINGRFFAELTKQVLSRYEASKGHNSAAELRLSIYGMERDEWLNLARWVLRNWEGGIFPGPVLSSHNRWMIQIPRLWRIYQKKDGHRSFQQMLENLFCPIFEATLYPEEHPEVSELLKHIVAFDSVDDEGQFEAACCSDRPSEWTDETNPAYSWQLYYLWANIEVLNQLRRARGLNTFSFRPHAGETGDVMHLAASYMLCESISHGISLNEQVSLQYLYYLDQVGISVAILSNNFLFRKIRHSPFPKLFQRGLNVTLSTDDPMLFHLSDDALLEEYSVARASFDLSLTDISELARNSVLQAGFEDEWKRKWLGDDYAKGVTFCDEHKTHVPLIRAKFRSEHLAMELMYVSLLAAGKGDTVLREMMMQFSHARDGHRKVLIDNFMEVPMNL